jgi:hypothetical protein
VLKRYVVTTPGDVAWVFAGYDFRLVRDAKNLECLILAVTVVTISKTTP